MAQRGVWCTDTRTVYTQHPEARLLREMGKWKLTPSLRVATFSHVNKDGQEVLVESDGRTKLCRHGETASSIRSWALHEARARAQGREPPPRNSACDCCRTLGLQTVIDTRPPSPPPSVYDLLACTGGEAIDLPEGGCSGGKAYRLGSHDGYLAADGGVYCVHGHRLRTRTRAKRPCVWSAPGKCKCRVVLPRRQPHLITMAAAAA